MKPHVETLKGMAACRAAIGWASRYPTGSDAWRACNNPDWMGWYLTRCWHGTCKGIPVSTVIIKALIACARASAPALRRREDRERFLHALKCLARRQEMGGDYARISNPAARCALIELSYIGVAPALRYLRLMAGRECPNFAKIIRRYFPTPPRFRAVPCKIGE